MLDFWGKKFYNVIRRLMRVTMLQIKVSGKVAEILDRKRGMMIEAKRGRKQFTYSQAIESFFPKRKSWLQLIFRKQDDG